MQDSIWCMQNCIRFMQASKRCMQACI
jgi:hypothetical protein